jgi:hypothetical protein
MLSTLGLTRRERNDYNQQPLTPNWATWQPRDSQEAGKIGLGDRSEVRTSGTRRYTEPKSSKRRPPVRRARAGLSINPCLNGSWRLTQLTAPRTAVGALCRTSGVDAYSRTIDSSLENSGNHPAIHDIEATVNTLHVYQEITQLAHDPMTFPVTSQRH